MSSHVVDVSETDGLTDLSGSENAENNEGERSRSNQGGTSRTSRQTTVEFDDTAQAGACDEPVTSATSGTSGNSDAVTASDMTASDLTASDMGGMSMGSLPSYIS